MRATRFFVLLAVTLALLASTASQDTAGEPEGFDVDAQAVRDAAVYLTPEEKGVISVGNDILRGNDTIPDAIPEYGDDTASAAFGDRWHAYPVGWHFVLVIVGGLVAVPLAAAACGPKQAGAVRKAPEYGAPV
jgi:hypothetical protein